MFCSSLGLQAQAQVPVSVNTVEEAITKAVEANRDLKIYALDIEKNQALLPTAFDLDKTSIYYHFDQNNIAPNDLPLKVWGIQQNFKLPSIYKLQRQLLEENVNLSQQEYAIASRNLSRSVAKAYYQVVYLQHLQTEYQSLDSLYANFAQSANRRFELGETNYLEKITAETQRQEIALLIRQNQQAIEAAYWQLKQYLQVEETVELTEKSLKRLSVLAPGSFAELPRSRYYQSAIQRTALNERLKKQQLLPDVQLEYFKEVTKI